MIYLILRCFSERAQTGPWQDRLRQMVPSFGHDLSKEFGPAEDRAGPEMMPCWDWPSRLDAYYLLGWASIHPPSCPEKAHHVHQ